MSDPFILLGLALKYREKLEYEMDLADAKAGAFREMGGGMIESSGGRPNKFVK